MSIKREDLDAGRINLADVVTGKLDVRGTAASIPEVTELESVDEPAVESLDEAIDESEYEEIE